MESENIQKDPKPANSDAGNYYPKIEIPRNSNPNRLYAIPLFGLLAKFILLIPVFIEIWALMIVTSVLVMLINPFAVLFTGKYIKVAYDLATGIMRLGARTNFYINGITDKYPGFSISTTPFTWNLAYPATSNRLFAIPLLGFLIRVIIMIPFSIFAQIIGYAANLAVFFIITPLSVLIKGYYPETAHELTVDSVRLSNASMAYIFGISDKYPSFKISWNHKAIKIVLIIISILVMLSNFGSSALTSGTKTDSPFQVPSSPIISIPPAATSLPNY